MVSASKRKLLVRNTRRLPVSGSTYLIAVQTGEIDIASIHDVEGAGFQRQVVERFDIVHFAAGNVDETRDVAAQINQRMQFDGRLAPAKVCPRKQGQAQIDGAGVEGVNRLSQIDS